MHRGFVDPSVLFTAPLAHESLACVGIVEGSQSQFVEHLDRLQILARDLRDPLLLVLVQILIEILWQSKTAHFFIRRSTARSGLDLRHPQGRCLLDQGAQESLQPRAHELIRLAHVRQGPAALHRGQPVDHPISGQATLHVLQAKVPPRRSPGQRRPARSKLKRYG